MKQRHLPFMSIVICTYNGAAVIGRAIESILEQDYPRDRFEIIVVDDGSKDNSAEVAGRYPVQVVSPGYNQGVAGARNTGLAHVRGDVYVCFDDDCTVASDWLRQLAAAYQLLPGIMGVGSVLAPPTRVSGLVDHFMVASGSGNPPSLKLGASKQPPQRFWAYLVVQLGFADDSGQTKPYPVRQLNGATASFPVDVLRAVGGWDAALRWIEDTDIGTRITKAFPGRHFYTVPAARLIHDPKMSLKTFVKRPYSRGLANLQFYNRNGITPPVFPFPLVWAVTTSVDLALDLPWGLVAALVLPQLLYIWWPLRAVRERSLWCFAFPYMQLAEEWSTIAGLVRGYIILRKKPQD